MSIKTYSELITIPTFEERFKYLRLNDRIGDETFGFDRYLNQVFYRSSKWRTIKNKVILRDNGCDLGVEEYPINGKVFVHHINPLSKFDIYEDTEYLCNMEYLITVSFETHNAIHFGSSEVIKPQLITREKYDTCPWKRR